MLLGLERSRGKVPQPVIKLTSNVCTPPHGRERHPQVLLYLSYGHCGNWLLKNPQVGKWVDNPLLPLAINVYSSEADLPSIPSLISNPLSRSSVDWRPRDVLAISGMSSAKAPAFTLNSPTITPSSGSNVTRAQSMTVLKRWTERGLPCLTPCYTPISSLRSGPIRILVLASP